MSKRKGPPRAKKQRVVEPEYLQNSDIEEELFVNCDEENQPGSDSVEYSSDEDCKEGLTFEQFPLVNIELQPIPSRPRPDEPSTSGSSSNWTSTGDMKNLHFNKINAFSGVVNGHEPINYFDYFFDQDLLSMICTETNSQAKRLKSVNESVKGRIKDWKELVIPELKIFLGLLLHMGTINLNRLQDYWKTDRLFNIPIFRQQMSRNRFLLILRCLHFTSESESEDPLYKIRNMIDYFNKKMEDCYYPCKELSLDESMVLWRGRPRGRQYIKNKPQKYGVKLYMLTQPDGLILRFHVYTGGKDIDASGKSHAEKVVMDLMEGKLGNGHELYIDNFYNSFGLAKRLLENNTYCTGTLRKNLKDNPIEVTAKKLKKGENVSLFREGVHIGKWQDKRPVMYITNQYANKMVPVVNKRGQTKKKPQAVAKYNEFMSGVDRQDQLLAFYPCERKTLRWYLKIAIHTLQLLFINSYKIYNQYSGQKKMTLYDYRLNIINTLLPVKSEPEVGVSLRSVRSRHYIRKITETNARGRIQRKMCRQCHKNKKRTDTSYQCVTCVEKPGLCPECFDKYHIEHNLFFS
ncbi:piggyBac transposable element-derived protein 4-like [Battus philenor]|uniref:piggyBac transposable element-derived protein 4-like n=1 Tax=Battus philenor TaxID=42288 RepID=UPI0035D0923D